ncbi:hypothetical protein AB0J83_30895 [Actinoplanes sp. NPDC049596]|uniref:hypothetical protein n=1 Tax=unclassified Actinoplanes TaxID=2626549 RepID=UPI00341816ED
MSSVSQLITATLDGTLSTPAASAATDMATRLATEVDLLVRLGLTPHDAIVEIVHDLVVEFGGDPESPIALNLHEQAAGAWLRDDHLPAASDLAA